MAAAKDNKAKESSDKEKVAELPAVDNLSDNKQAPEETWA